MSFLIRTVCFTVVRAQRGCRSLERPATQPTTLPVTTDQSPSAVDDIVIGVV